MICKLCNKDIPIKSYGNHVGKCKGGRKRYATLLEYKTQDDDDADATHHKSGDYRQSLLLNKKQKPNVLVANNGDDDSCINFDGCGACDSPLRECDIYFSGVEETRREGFDEYNEPLSLASTSSGEEDLSEDDHATKVPVKISFID